MLNIILDDIHGNVSYASKKKIRVVLNALYYEGQYAQNIHEITTPTKKIQHSLINLAFLYPATTIIRRFLLVRSSKSCSIICLYSYVKLSPSRAAHTVK